MKTKTLLPLLLIMAFFACKRLELIPAVSENKNLKIDKFSAAVPTTSSTLYRGLYLDSTSYILGDTVKENKVLNWCAANQIKTITYYDIKRSLEVGKSGQLANFLKRARTDYGIKENAVVVASYYRIQHMIDTFNNNKVDTLKRFNWVHFELEWWNGESTFSNYISELSTIKAWGLTQTPKIRTENYIGWFTDPSGQDSLMASSLIQNSDRIHVHDYYPSPSWNYIQNRVDYLGRAAHALGKQVPIIPIFNADVAVTGTYFQTNSFDSAYETVINGYSASTIPKKSNVDIIGYQLFSYSEARDARPLPKIINFKVSNAPSKPISGTIRIYDNVNKLIDTKNFYANTNVLEPMKQPNNWRMEVDVTNAATVRYVMEVYIKGNFVESFTIAGSTTRTLMKVPFPSGLHNLQGNVTLTFYPY
jgi:hypothetical protein